MAYFTIIIIDVQFVKSEGAFVISKINITNITDNKITSTFNLCHMWWPFLAVSQLNNLNLKPYNCQSNLDRPRGISLTYEVLTDLFFEVLLLLPITCPRNRMRNFNTNFLNNSMNNNINLNISCFVFRFYIKLFL